jgi:hypothetical protein
MLEETFHTLRPFEVVNKRKGHLTHKDLGNFLAGRTHFRWPYCTSRFANRIRRCSTQCFVVGPMGHSLKRRRVPLRITTSVTLPFHSRMI